MISIKKIKILIVGLCLSWQIMAQGFTVCGYVTEQNTGEKLISASVVNNNTGKVTATNNYGFFSLQIPKGHTRLTFSYVGYKPQIVELMVVKDTVCSIQLIAGTELETITVVSKSADVNLRSVSRFEIPIKTIKQIPVLLGEADVFKAIQMLPGIQSGMEGSAGMFVRGGNAGENQILIDGIPVYNPNHLYGFFSVFNTDAVKNVSVYKGAFPARYSGGTASVIDVRMKEGSAKEFSVDGSVGLISSKIKIEGPVVKDKTSFLISGRRTYIDAFTRPLKSSGIMDADFPSYYFYDINAKINHKITDKSRVYLAFYTGKDHILDESKKESYTSESEDFSSSTIQNSGWGNTTFSLRLNQQFSGSLFANMTLAYSRYNYQMNDKYQSSTFHKIEDLIWRADYNLDYKARISDAIAKLDMDWYKSSLQTIRFGINSTQRIIKTGDTHYQLIDEAAKTRSDTSVNLPVVTGLETNLYVEDDLHFGKCVVNAGFNYSFFQLSGKLYQSLQPRFSATIPIWNKLSIKAGYSQMVQYIHLISETNVRMVSDSWIAVNEKIPPLKAAQVDVGLGYQITSSIGFTIETYVKKIDNCLGLLNGETIYLAGKPLENMLETGNGLAKGIEIQVNKTEGKTTGWINYTLAKSERNFPTINEGKTYPFKYDRRHTINVVINHSFTNRISINLSWLFGTGYPQTLSVSQYMQALPMWDSKGKAEGSIGYFNSLNNYRLPLYHRLDLGITFNRKRGAYHRSWNFGLYNAYMRSNPVYQYYSGYKKKNLESVSLLPIVPYVTYNFSF